MRPKLIDLTKEELIKRLEYSEALLLRYREANSFDQWPEPDQRRDIDVLNRETTEFTGVPHEWLEGWKNLPAAMDKHIRGKKCSQD